MSPRPHVDHLRRPQILTAALSVIAERGLGATRITDIAERADTSPAAILYWFDSKDELLTAALIEGELRFFEEASSWLAELDGAPAKLRALFVACADDAGWPLWIELWSRALHDRGVRAEQQRLENAWRELLGEVIAEGVEAGDFSTGSPQAAALVLSAIIDGLAIQLALDGGTMTPERMLDLCLANAGALLGAELPRASSGERRGIESVA